MSAMSYMGLDWTYENVLACIHCPYKRVDCQKRHPYLREAEGILKDWCNVQLTAEPYSYDCFLIRNTVNTRLFGACNPKKIIFDLSHYAESRPGAILGGFFAWIDRKEAEK